MSAFSCLSPPTCSLSTQSAATALSLLSFNTNIKSIIIKSNIDKSKPKTLSPNDVVRKSGLCLQCAANVKLWSERASVCVSGVRLQDVTGQDTSLETTLHTEGRTSYPAPPPPSLTLYSDCPSLTLSVPLCQSVRMPASQERWGQMHPHQG